MHESLYMRKEALERDFAKETIDIPTARLSLRFLRHKGQYKS